MPRTVEIPGLPIRSTEAPTGNRFARRLIACLVLSVPALAAAVQQAHIGPGVVRLPIVDGKGIRFTRITTADGLSQTRVTQMVQDDQGFMWFGTQYGLDRYD